MSANFSPIAGREDSLMEVDPGQLNPSDKSQTIRSNPTPNAFLVPKPQTDSDFIHRAMTPIIGGSTFS